MMFLSSFLLVLMLAVFDIGGAIDCKLNTPNVTHTIIVDLSGHGNFSKVQDAINSIPSSNTQWIRISLNPGIYREQVKVPVEKSCILLEGQSLKTTSIEFDAITVSDMGATFTVVSDNFVAKHISFKNTYNMEAVGDGGSNNSSKKVIPAVAITIKGDKSSFYDCGFYGVQDTLWDGTGRHFFNNCVIQGAVDFIWGSGQSIYKNCQIIVNGDAIPGLIGYITAQGRETEDVPHGFVFTGGNVTGKGSAFLGRAYRIYSRVIFEGTMFSEVVNPVGWDAWRAIGKEGNLMYAESNCHGPGSDTSKRVSWEKKLSPEQLHQFTDISFIDKEGWLSKQP